jgi:large subunit ribosomal protein L19
MNEARIAAVRAAKGYPILPVKPGMQLEIHEKVTDGNNTRIWRFKGLVIKVVKPKHADGTFTVRGKSAGVTIEKIYPLSYPHFDSLILLDQFKARRAKLYYIRDKVGKDAKMTSLLTNADK